MTDIKARYTGPAPDGVTLGVILDDGDLYPYHVKQGGELPQEIDGRKVAKSVPGRPARAGRQLDEGPAADDHEGRRQGR
jgi:hypothetical protein